MFPSPSCFHWCDPTALKAGSEGELCTADALGSAGSSSTLASSVIEVDVEQDDPRRPLQRRTEQRGEEEEDDEELNPLSPPPALSITEEILEFINQSRTRERTTSMEQTQDQLSETKSPSNRTNFSCPLPPISSSPEQRPSSQQERELENDTSLQNQPSENPAVTNKDQEFPEASSPAEKTQDEDEEDKAETHACDTEDVGALDPSTPTILHPSIPSEKIAEISCDSPKTEADQEFTHSSQSPGLTPPSQKCQPLKRSSHFTKRDQKIIEKIRSYYEAAAETEEDKVEEEEEVEEEEPGEGELSRRRNSFSQIPSGLVKESVSRFSVGEHPEEPTSPQSPHKMEVEAESSSLAAPTSPPAESNPDEDKPVGFLPSAPAESIVSDVIEATDSPNQSDPNPNLLVEQEIGIQDGNGNVCEGYLDEGVEETEEGETLVGSEQHDGESAEEEKSSVSEHQDIEEENTTAVSQTNIKDHDPKQAEPNMSPAEPPTHQPREEQHQNTKEDKDVSSLSKTKNGDQAKSKRNLEGFPSQIKVGRWSRHSRIVTANRALFEGMASDVTGIGLFEANPVVDPVLMENSERILSKVQTLARMYTAKASTMKVPLHHKRASSVRSQLWASTRLSRTSTGNQNKSSAQPEMDLSQSKPEPQTSQQLGGPDSQNQTWQIQRTQEEGWIKTDDLQEKVVSPHEPLLCDFISPTCPRGSGFNLSRPRDFISALTKDSSLGFYSSGQPATSQEAPSSPSSNCSQSEAQSHRTTNPGPSAETPHQSRTKAETQESGWFCSTNTPFSAPPTVLGSSELRESSAEPGRAVCSEEPPKSDDLELNEELCVYSVGEDSTSIGAHPVPAEPSPSALSTLQRQGHRGSGDKHQLDSAVVEQKPDQQEPEGIYSRLNNDKDLSDMMTGSPGSGSLLWMDATNGEEASRQLLRQAQSEYSSTWMSPPGMSVELIKQEVLVEEQATGRSKKHSNDGDPSMICAEDLVPGDLPILPPMSLHMTSDPPQAQESSSPWISVQSSVSTDPCPSSSADFLPTFTSLRPVDLPTTQGKQASAVSWISSSTSEDDIRRPDQPVSGSSSHTSTPVTFRPSFKDHSSSPLRSPPTSSVPSPPCSSHFRVIPASSPTPVSPAGFPSKALSCLSPSRSSCSSTDVPSSGRRSSSSRTDRDASQVPPSSLCSPPCSSSVASAFTRSLAASCISQSISQSMAKHTARQQATPTPTPHLQRCSPFPKPCPSRQDPSAPAYSQLGVSNDSYQHSSCPPSSLRSLCPSPSLVHSPSVPHFPPSPSASLHQRFYSSPPSPRPPFLHSKTDPLKNGNRNNSNNKASAATRGAVSDVGWSLADGDAMLTTPKHTALWSGSHNRVAQPFSASEPSSRVQSPSPSPTPASFFTPCSPPPQHNYSSPMANKPPHPRSTRVGGSHNHSDLHMDLPRASSVGSAFGDSSFCLSPRTLSPPPIGVPAWTNNVATPQPRNPRCAPSSPSYPSALRSPTQDVYPFHSSPSSSFVPGRSLNSGSCPLPSQTLRRSLSSNLADRPSSAAQSSGSGISHSLADRRRRSLGFSSSSVQECCDPHESCPTSGWSSRTSSPSCLSPGAGIRSLVSPSRFSPAKGSHGGQHHSSIPWSELSNPYNGTETDATSTIIASSPPPLSSLRFIASPGPSNSQNEWGASELEEGSCRSQLICAYVGRPSQRQNMSSSCLVFSSSGMTSPPPNPYRHNQIQVQRQTTSPVSSPAPLRSSPLPSGLSSPTRLGNQKASYATTVNLQIAGSGRITSFSTAQVSLTQTLQGGAVPPGPGQVARRVSINGLSPVPQSYNQL
nr:mucin-2-like [Nothobranchius furzeri]